MSADHSFPYPVPDLEGEPYWEACNRGELAMQRCVGCRRLRWTPSPYCPACGSDTSAWEALSGRGRVTTWTVVTHPVHPAAVDRVPYIVVEVELVEQAGLRMISNLVGIAPERVGVDLRVELAFEDHPSGQKLPIFRPAS